MEINLLFNLNVHNGLKYYTLLDLENNASNICMFNNFCQEVYPQLLNDYQYIIKTLKSITTNTWRDNK